MGSRIRYKKTRVLGAAQSKNFVILACTVLILLASVTNGQTDEQTPRSQLKRAKRCAVARKNG